MAFKNIIIIGASSGIGRELALLYGREAGSRLGLIARREAALGELAALCEASLEICPLDLAAADRNDKFVALLERFNYVDLIIYCAGYGEINPDLNWEHCRETLDVNVNGFTEIINTSYLFMAKRKTGRIAVISSVAAMRGAENDSGYAASKSYMLRYVEGLARKARLEKSGICFSTILPGFVDTQMAKGDKFFWMCSAEVAARQIFAGLQRGTRYLYVTRRWRLIAWLLKLIP